MGVWLLILLYLILISPLRAGVVFSLGRGMPRAGLGIMIWGFSWQFHGALIRDKAGRLHLEASNGSGRKIRLRGLRGPSPSFGRLVRSFQKADRARALLRCSVHLESIRAAVEIGGGNAARTALWTGALMALGGILPPRTLLCRPAFGRESALRFHCIADARLGTLLTACLLGALAFLRTGRKEEKAWNIPSGT